MAYILDSAIDAVVKAALPFLPDKADLLEPTSTADGYGAQTISETELVTDIPCLWELLSPSVEMTIGTKNVVLTHKLWLESTEKIGAIKPSYRIRIQAREAKGEIIFEQPVRLDESFNPLVAVLAKLRNA